MADDAPVVPAPASVPVPAPVSDMPEWQQRLRAAAAPPPRTPWYEAVARSRLAVAAGAAVLALLLLALLAPPMVQQTSDTAFEGATLSVPRLLIWSGVVGGVVFAAPYAWAALQGSGSSSSKRVV